MGGDGSNEGPPRGAAGWGVERASVGQACCVGQDLPRSGLVFRLLSWVKPLYPLCLYAFIHLLTCSFLHSLIQQICVEHLLQEELHLYEKGIFFTKGTFI